MKGIGFFFVLGLVFISMIGCRGVEKQATELPAALEGYSYDEQTGHYINHTTGVWYIIENGYRVIPPEQYLDRETIGPIEGIGIANRPNDVWVLKEVRDVTILPGDSLAEMITPYYMGFDDHFRIDPKWYTQQVLELNNITDPHFIRADDILKMPIYIDSR